MSFGVGSFPTESNLMQKYTTLFEAGKAVMVIAMPSLIIGRSLLNMFHARANQAYSEIIKDTFVSCILLAGFLTFLKYTLELPGMMSSYFPNQGTYSINLADTKEHGAFFDTVHYITIGCFYLASALYAAILFLVSLVGAYVICLGQMLNAKWIIKAFAFGVLIISSWPLFWYALNMAISSLSGEDSFVNGIIVTTFNILKCLTPILTLLYGIKTPLGNAVKTGASAAASFVSGGVGIGGKAALGTISKLGGQGIINGFNTKRDAVSDKLNSTLAKTLPSMGSLAVAGGGLVGKGFTQLSPSAAEKVKTAKNFFKDKNDMFSGNAIPGSSEFSSSLRSAKRSTNAAVTGAGASIVSMGKSSLSMIGSQLAKGQTILKPTQKMEVPPKPSPVQARPKPTNSANNESPQKQTALPKDISETNRLPKYVSGLDALPKANALPTKFKKIPTRTNYLPNKSTRY